MYDCDTCNKTYKHKRNLIRHIMENHNEALGYFNCPEKGCKSKIIRRDYLREHLVKLHNISREDARTRSYSVCRSKCSNTLAVKHIDKERYMHLDSNVEKYDDISSEEMDFDIECEKVVDYHDNRVVNVYEDITNDEIDFEPLKELSELDDKENHTSLAVEKGVIDFSTSLNDIIDKV